MHLVRLRPERSSTPGSRGFSRIFGAALLTVTLAGAASAQNRSGDGRSAVEAAEEAFFHLSVSGEPRDPDDPRHEALRQGKAFAVAPNMLVTAQHLVGDQTQWKLSRTTRDEITRAVRPLAREIRLNAASGTQLDSGDVIVLPAASPAIDAAAIFVPGLGLDTAYRLSLCDIREGETYTALMSGAHDPALPDSIEDLRPIRLRATGYRPAEYGALYVFLPADAPEFSTEPWGHGGSPILDGDDHVVAIISAVTVTAEGPKILATPIQPLFPGTNRLLARAPDVNRAQFGSLKCSMVDMLKRVHDQVASHAIWSVSAETDDGEATGDILFDYESVADPPNIASIEVSYQFWGTESAGDELTRIAHRPSKEDVVVLEPGRRLRSFSTSEVVRVGRQLVEPYIAEGGGAIRFVRLTVTPTLDSGKLLDNRRKVYELQWSGFQ